MLKKSLVLVAALAALSISGTCFAKISSKEATFIAQKEIPANIAYQGVKTEETEYKVYFFDNSTNREYKVEIDAETGKVTTLEIHGSNIVGSTTICQKEPFIREVVLEKYPDAKNLVIKLEKEGNNSHYEAEFSTAKYSKVEMKINPVTGAIGHEELTYR